MKRSGVPQTNSCCSHQRRKAHVKLILIVLGIALNAGILIRTTSQTNSWQQVQPWHAVPDCHAHLASSPSAEMNYTKMTTHNNESSLTVHAVKKRHGLATFVPFPHRLDITKDLVGEAAACTWETWPLDAQSLLGVESPDDGVDDLIIPDAVQQAALTEGMCLPNNPELRSKLHLFSQAQAIQCLSPHHHPSYHHHKHKPIRLVLSGDSYNRQLFIGLADILLGDASSENLHNERQRHAALTQRSQQLVSAQDLGNGISGSTSLTNVIPVCWDNCMGQSYRGQTFQTKCHWCINGYTNTSHYGNSKSNTTEQVMYTAVVVGAAVHVQKALGGDPEKALADLIGFLQRNPRVLLNTMSAYHVHQLPAQFRNAPHHNNTFLYESLLQWHRQQARPTIDFFQPTLACTWSNCSADGGHRTRFVNRWKAQLLLNALCEFDPSPPFSLR